MKKNKNTRKNPVKNISKKNEILLLGIVLVLTFIVFSPALKNDFTNWDDHIYVTENNVITTISLDSLSKFGDNIAGNFHPLTMLSLAIDYHFFKLDPFYYHLKNILFHLINTILVFVFIKKAAKNNLFITLLTTLLFAIHPMHVESVAWISERKDVLYTFYFLIGLIFYYRYLERKRIVFLVAATLSFIISTLSKSAAVVFPVVLLIIDYFEDRKFSWKTIAEKIPLFLISVYIGLKALNTQSDSIRDLNVFSVFERIQFASYGFISYLVKFMFPHHLSPFHPFPDKGNIPVGYNLAIIAFLVIIVFLIWNGRKRKWLVFGVGFYFVTVALVLQFISVGKAVIAERYTYVPYIGLGFVYAYILNLIFTENRNLNLKYLAGVFLGIQLLFFAGKTYNRTKIWQNSETLWTDVIEKYPEQSVAYTNRGHYYRSIKDDDRALQDYTSAIKLNDVSGNAYFNRGKIYFDRGKFDLALEDYNQCYSILPDFADVLNNRGLIYIFKKEYDKALDDLNKSIELDPQRAKAFSDRGFLYFQLKQYENSIQDNEQALRLDPANQDVLNTNGLCYYYLNNYEKAINEFNRCIAINAKNCLFYLNRSMALNAAGEKSKALQDAIKAQQLGCNVNPELLEKLKQ